MDGQNFQNRQNGVNQGYQGNGMQPPQKTNVLAIVGMILGILSIIVSCCFVYYGIIFAIAGLICSILSRKQGKSGMGTAGLVCSIVGLVIGVVMTVLALIGFAALSSPEFMQEMQNYMK